MKKMLENKFVSNLNNYFMKEVKNILMYIRYLLLLLLYYRTASFLYLGYPKVTSKFYCVK